jgi:hypothetical protein
MGFQRASARFLYQPPVSNGGVASGVDNGQGQGVRNEFTSSTGISQKGIRSALVMANVLQHVSCTSRRFQPDGVASGVDNGQGQDVRNESISSTGISQKGIRSAPVLANVLQHVSCTSRRIHSDGVASGWRLLSGAGRLFLLHHHQNHPSQNRTFVLKSKP